MNLLRFVCSVFPIYFPLAGPVDFLLAPGACGMGVQAPASKQCTCYLFCCMIPPATHHPKPGECRLGPGGQLRFAVRHPPTLTEDLIFRQAFRVAASLHSYTLAKDELNRQIERRFCLSSSYQLLESNQRKSELKDKLKVISLLPVLDQHSSILSPCEALPL